MKDRQPQEDSNTICFGLDVGTMFLGLARSDTKEVKLMRNVFLPLSQDDISISELSDISYVQSDENLFIIGDDAFRFANMFAKEISRPMKNGMISPREIYAIDVLTMMIKTLIGDYDSSKEIYCSYSIPAESIDEERSVIYHQKVFSRILGALNINHTAVNEAAAIIYNECAKEKFSGIGISFGAGMCNCVLMLNGIEVLKFSTTRSGDYIDKKAAESLDIIVNRISAVKEKHLNLKDGFSTNPDRKVRRILESLEYYYSSVIDYTVKKICKEFENKVEIEMEDKIPIVISGGTSLPEGFLELFTDSINKNKIPFQISEIRRAKNPLTCVSEGLLVKTISDVNKIRNKK